MPTKKLKLATRVSLVYAAAAGLWILLSDRLVAWWWPDAVTITHFQTYKGLVFVLFTALLLFAVLRRQTWLMEAEAAERRKAEADLARNHEQYRQAITAAEAVPYTEDYASASYTFMGEGIQRLIGYSPGELSPKVWDGLVEDYVLYGELAGLPLAEAMRRTRTGEFMNWRADFCIRTKQGETRWVADSSIQVRGTGGPPAGSVGIIQDITERKRAEQALRESESRFRQLAESLPQMVWTSTPAGQCDYLNQRWVDYTGIPADAQLGLDWVNQIHPEDRGRLTVAWTAAVANGNPFHLEYRVRRRDGIYRWFDDRAIALRDGTGRVVKWCGSVTDIHEQRELREKLRANEEKLRTIFEAEPECLKLLEPDGTLREINSAGLNLLEVGQAKEVLGKCIVPFILPEHQPAVRAMLEASGRGESSLLEFQIRGGKGTARWMEMRTVPFRDPATGQALVLAVSRDVSERRRTEEALRLSKERLRACIENTPNVAVQWYNDAGQVIYWNQASENVFGWPAHEALGRTVDQLTQTPAQAAQFRATLRALKESNRIVGPVESPFHRKDGSPGVRLSTLFTIPFDASTTCFVSMDLDISALKQSRAEVEQSLSLLRATLESTAEGILVVDREGRITSHNQKFLELWRTPAALIAGGDDQTAINAVLDQLAESEAFQQLKRELNESPESSTQDVIRLKDGRTFERYSHPQRLGQQIVGRVWSFRDVTERRRMERLVVQSELRLRLVWENALDAMRLAEADGIVVLVNRAYCNLTGKSRSELEGHHFTGLFSATQRAQAQADFAARFDRRDTCHVAAVEICYWNGRRGFLETSDIFLDLPGEAPLLLSILNDVTDRHQAEQQNTVFAAMVHELSAATSRVTAASLVVEAAQKLLGWDACFLYLYDSARDHFENLVMRDTFGGKIMDVPPPPEDQRPGDSLRRLVQRGPALVLRDGGGGESVKFLPFGDTQRRSASLMFVPILERGKPVGVLSIQSYTPRAYTPAGLATLTSLAEHCAGALARLRAEEVLQQNERRFRSLIENASDLITVLDPGGKVIFQSPSIQSVLGYAPDNWLGRNALALVHPEDRSRAAAALQQALTQPGQSATFEGRLRHRSGTYRRLEVIGRWAESETGAATLILNSRDVTQSRALEEQLRHVQKMEAIGHLAGGVAHDFNNLLAVILMQVELLNLEASLSTGQKECLDEVGKAAQRAANLTRQLLLFSRRQAMKPRAVDLNEVVVTMSKMLQRLLGEDITVDASCAPRPLIIHADQSMLDQVLLNLAVNSRDAMPRGGRLTLETRHAELDALEAAAGPHARPGSFACLVVRDTGEGMSPEILSHIFEPFFTTKDVGKGTGLGLATVFGIIEQHLGWITVDSSPDRGTTFRIYLPLEDARPLARPAEPTLAAAARGHETILLVEDEAALRTLVRRVLTRLGYRVLEAPNGVAALAVWRQHRAGIKLLLTDVVMPDGISGKELARRLQSENPALKVIYTSGYSQGVAGLDPSLREGDNFLTKPFQATKLAAAVRARLDG